MSVACECSKMLCKKIDVLKNIYSSIPATKCVKATCADWCCTKLEESKDQVGNFMSLPLIYTIEYYAILKYIRETFTFDVQEQLINPSLKTEKCVFRKSGENAGCMIYPVRPFSCRVYGRTVPDVFWGLEYPEGAAKIIDCPNCIPEDKKLEADFVKRYSEIWDDLRDLSVGLSTVPDGCVETFREVSGINEVLILGWYERNELLRQNLSWYKKGFGDWWNTFTNLL